MIEIRKVKTEEMDQAIALILKTFLEYVAVDYTDEGIKEFKRTIKDKNWIMDKDFYGAFFNKKIIGVIAVKDYSHIALFFVDSKYHGKGIGKRLFQKVCEFNKTGFYTVNASLYAKVIYEHLGFTGTTCQSINGLKFYPMKNNQILNYKK